MKAIDKVMNQLGVVPRLKLAYQVEKISQRTGKPYQEAVSLGPKHVKFLEEPKLVQGKDFESGNARQELKFLLEYEGKPHRWLVPILNKNGEPNYLIERLADINVGDEAVLEMKRGKMSYIEVTKLSSGEISAAPDLDEVDGTLEVSHEDNQDISYDDAG